MMHGMISSDNASVAPSVLTAPSMAPSVSPSIKRQFGDYEERFQSIDNEIDALRTSFDLDPDAAANQRLDLSVLESRIGELESAETKLMSERHKLHKMLLLEKEKLIQMREEERLKKLAEEQLQQYQNTTNTTTETTTTVRSSTSSASNNNTNRIPTEILSTSQKRASEFRSSTGTGLFEISKQLQISHAKNEASEIEINRLERQLRLLADLQGVNVGDLRRALENACADEAFGELQHRIAKLQAELEAAKLMKQQPGSNLLSLGNEEDDEEKERLRDELDAAQYQIQQQQIEIDKLKAMVEARDRRIEVLEAKHRESIQSMDSGVNAMTREYEELLTLVAQKEAIADAAKSALEAEREKSMVHERQLLLNNEKLRQKELMEQKEQHFHQVLALEKKVIRTENHCADRIKDMEQQLASLYAAVGVINEDHNADKEQRNRLSNDLEQADSKVASQLQDADTRGSITGVASAAAVPDGGGTGGRLYSTLLMNELMTMKAEAASLAAAGVPMAMEEATPLEAFTMTGTLLVKSKGAVALRKWKPKHSRLFLCGDHYQLDVGDKSYYIQFGITKIEFNPNHPLSFVIQTDPNDVHAPVVAAAATNEEDYHKWISALGKAANGDG